MNPIFIIHFAFTIRTRAYIMAEEQKTPENFEKKEMTFPEFLSKSFECLFEQNRMLHLGLKETLDKNLKSLKNA